MDDITYDPTLTQITEAQRAGNEAHAAAAPLGPEAQHDAYRAAFEAAMANPEPVALAIPDCAGCYFEGEYSGIHPETDGWGMPVGPPEPGHYCDKHGFVPEGGEPFNGQCKDRVVTQPYKQIAVEAGS